MVDMVSKDDDFFAMGGNSISAAHVSHNLGIDMRWLYIFPTPRMLEMALLQKEGLCDVDVSVDLSGDMNTRRQKDNFLISVHTKAPSTYGSKPRGRSMRTLHGNNYNYPAKFLKVDSNLFLNSKGIDSRDPYFWNCNPRHMVCSFSRCNKILYEGEFEGNVLYQATWSMKVTRDVKAVMQELWKVHMESCIDGSPIIVFKDGDTFLFIGSHSHKFLCIDAKSGFVRWEIRLDGRIECSAAILGDFSQVVVGCYQGNIYFIDFLNGNICWTFKTCGEVKSQPVVDKCRNLVWCGSYDHNLYALDYRNYCCVYKLQCGGSIYGSPAIYEFC